MYNCVVEELLASQKGLCSMELILCSGSETVDNLQYPHICVLCFAELKVLTAIHVYCSLVGIVTRWNCHNFRRFVVILYFGDRASRRKVLLITNLMHFFVYLFIYLFHLSTCFEHEVLIIRSSICINTSSGMISMCKWRLGMPVGRELPSWPAYQAVTYRG